MCAVCVCYIVGKLITFLYLIFIYFQTYLKADSAKRTKLLVYVIPTGKSDTYAPPEGASIYCV